MSDYFRALLLRRARLRSAIEEARKSREDIVRYGDEGARAATYAAMWATVMMVTDILKIGISAFDPEAARAFDGLDALISKADTLMQLFGARPMTKKADLLNQVDPNLQNGAKVIGYIRTASGAMQKAVDGASKGPRGAKLSGQALENVKQIDLVVRIGVAMAGDTVLLMQTGQLQSQGASTTNHALAAIDRQINNMARMAAEIDRQVDYLLVRAPRVANIV